MWRTLPNFNPVVASSEPGQDLDGQAQQLLFPSCRNGNVSEDEVEDASPLDTIEDAGALEDDNDAPDQV